MLASISPVGEASRHQRWWLTATAYTLASTAGGATTGVVLGTLGAGVTVAIPASARLGVLAAATAAGVTVDRRLVGTALPTRHRQVDERWLGTYRGWVYGVGFGFQLGLGVVTVVPASATYVALLAALLAGDWRAGLAIGASFGAVRALPVLATVRVRTPRQLRILHARLARLGPRWVRATSGLQAIVAGVATLAVVT